MIFFTTCLLATLCPATASAESVTPEEAVRAALDRHPAIAEAKARVERAKASLKAVEAGYEPSMTLSANALQGDNPQEGLGVKLLQSRATARDLQPDQLQDPRAYQNVQGRIALNLSVHDPQRIDRIESARAEVRAAEENIRAVTQGVVYQTLEQFYSFVLARADAVVLQARIDDAEDELREALALKNQGLVLGSDYHLARAVLGQMKQQQVRLNAQIKTARAALNIAMGRQAGQALEPAGRIDIDSPPAARLSDLQAGLDRRPERQAAREQIAAAKTFLAAEAKSNRPVVTGFGQVEENVHSIDRHANNYLVGLRLTAPIFDPVDPARENLRKADVREAEARMESVKDLTELDFERRLHEYDGIREEIPVARQTLGESKEALGMFRKLYKSGKQSIADVLEAEMALYQSHANLNQTYYALRTAYARLLLAAGQLESAPVELK